MFQDKSILLIVTGGIAAYKTPELVRQLIKAGASVRCVLSPGAQQFVTPLALASVSGERVYTDLFSLTDEHEMGHIELSRQADVILVAPATANILAKMAHGLADDLPSTLLLATDKPVIVAPAMNVRMWEHAATQNNIEILKSRGIITLGPDEGDMACGEFGFGRMSEPEDMVNALSAFFNSTTEVNSGPLKGLTALVTSGPTVEPIDPVRFIANRSSGKQGHAIAVALQHLGADVTLISGPVNVADPDGVRTEHVETAAEMLVAAQSHLPTDLVVAAAAVADWRVDGTSVQKIKKVPGEGLEPLKLVENPDILATLSAPGPNRPRLIVGFAAETENVVENGRAKLAKKGCDWIVANSVSAGSGTFGGDMNTVDLITRTGVEHWPAQPKIAVAAQLAQGIADFFANQKYPKKVSGA